MLSIMAAKKAVLEHGHRPRDEANIMLSGRKSQKEMGSDTFSLSVWPETF
jgi:hypothetical protein